MSSSDCALGNASGNFGGSVSDDGGAYFFRKISERVADTVARILCYSDRQCAVFKTGLCYVCDFRFRRIFRGEAAAGRCSLCDINDKCSALSSGSSASRYAAFVCGRLRNCLFFPAVADVIVPLSAESRGGAVGGFLCGSDRSCAVSVCCGWGESGRNFGVDCGIAAAGFVYVYPVFGIGGRVGRNRCCRIGDCAFV